HPHLIPLVTNFKALFRILNRLAEPTGTTIHYSFFRQHRGASAPLFLAITSTSHMSDSFKSKITAILAHRLL
ncbi:MAG: hypothetical protein PVG64_01580, partial [Syntrophobacterales bacterium]